MAAAGKFPVIPDLKPVSPAEGPLFPARDIALYASQLVNAGACVLSVVTEPVQFGGSMEQLRHVAESACVPVLRKDFIRTRRDVDETANAGAAAILLICACLSRSAISELYLYALEKGLEPLVETHTEEELLFASSLGAELIGINNKDILRLEKDGGTVAATAALARNKPAGAMLISESGIMNAADVRTAAASGADAVLVGTSIWKADDPFAFYRKLCGAVQDHDQDAF